MLYLFSGLDHFTDHDLMRACRILPPERQEHILRFRKKEDQKRSAIGCLLLIYGLQQEYGITSLPDYRISAHGKPYFEGQGLPCFSISHSGSLVGCAIHSSEIGLDIQQIIPVKPSLIKRICTDQELETVCPSGDPSVHYEPSEFFRIWSAKESTSKLLGTGITSDFRDILVLHPEISVSSFSLKQGKYLASLSFRNRQAFSV